MRKEAVANPVPYIVGCNNTEGHGIMTVSFPKDFKSGITKESYETSFKGFFGAALYVSWKIRAFSFFKSNFFALTIPFG